MIKIIVASNNQHKISEIKSIFNNNDQKYEILSLKDANILSNPDETGSTFKENALIKALDAKKFTNHIVIADDSGLIVKSLNDKPGVYSKRYAGLNATDKENNEKLIKVIEDIPVNERLASFSTVICIIIKKKIFYVKGDCKGTIITKPTGNNGFGYDPIFYVKEFKKTFAQLSEIEKNSISHRGKAIRACKELLEKELS